MKPGRRRIYARIVPRRDEAMGTDVGRPDRHGNTGLCFLLQMSSGEDIGDVIPGLARTIHRTNAPQDGKRRKMMRACDACRRKKIRCDAHEDPAASRCSYCQTHGVECTFVGAGTKNRAPPKEYTDELEKRSALLEAIIRRLAPQLDIAAEAGPTLNRDTWTKSSETPLEPSPFVAVKIEEKPLIFHAPAPRHSPSAPESPPPQHCFMFSHDGIPVEPPVGLVDDAPISSSYLSSEEDTNDPDPGVYIPNIEEGMQTMKISGGFQQRFHGKSSGVSFVQEAMSMKQDTIKEEKGLTTGRFPRRLQFWQTHPWERLAGPPTPLEALRFPPEALAKQLVNACFDQCLLLFPILHRPTFERNRKAKLHKVDIRFARIYLLACAVGSRYVTDQRTCFKTPSGEVLWNSTGWIYYQQVATFNKSLVDPATLSEMQCCALSALFHQGGNSPHASWLACGFGIRQCLDIGAHREKAYSKDPQRAFDNQMWKRVFWSLVAIDRAMSTSLGRPLSIGDEERVLSGEPGSASSYTTLALSIDAELPLEVDDEYYNALKHEWKQPDGKPGRIAASVQFLKLLAIPSHAIRTVYAINKFKESPEDDWESQAVAELDSAMNSWLDGIPDHLKWHSHIEDPIYSQQAAALRLGYHFVQITVHRPFIPMTSGNKSKLSLPSLAICTNAARAASHILEVCASKGFQCTPVMHVAAFSSGITLLMGIWTVNKGNIKADLSQHVSAFQRCMQSLELQEKGWPAAGKFRDILMELAALNDVPIEQLSKPDVGLKRRREVQELRPIATVTTTPPPPAPMQSDLFAYLFSDPELPRLSSPSSSNPTPTHSSFSTPPFPAFLGQTSDFAWPDVPGLSDMMGESGQLHYATQHDAFTPPSGGYDGSETGIPVAQMAYTTSPNSIVPNSGFGPKSYDMDVDTMLGTSMKAAQLGNVARPNDEYSWLNSILMSDSLSGPLLHYPSSAATY